jgi:ribose transport system permease protein
MRNYGILLALVIFVAVVHSQNEQFLTRPNLLNILGQWAPVGIMAIGQTYVLLGGGFDLSQGAVYAFSASLAAGIGASHADGLGFAAAIALGAGVGLVNGVLITKGAINPFIATLGTAFVFRGLAYVYTDATVFKVESSFYKTVGNGRVGDVPVAGMILLGMLVLGGLILWRTIYGRAIYSVGGNLEASYLAGLRTDALRISTYVVSGMTASLAGVMLVGRLGAGQANLGVGIEFDILAACLIGGVSIGGGVGAMWQTGVGLVFLATLQNFFNLTSVSAYWQQVVKGLIIVGAVGLDAYMKKPHRRSLRKRRRRDQVSAAPGPQPQAQ